MVRDMLNSYMATRRSHMTLRSLAAQIIREHRTSANVSQIELAAMLNVSQPLVSAWECGKVIPCIDDLVAIEVALKQVKGKILMKVAYPD